jgi:Domain of unknown function (DUF5680)
MDSGSTARLSAFLVEAKRRTYAGLDDDATVPAQIFPGSKQLEYREGDLSYRDIYFGMNYFVGQEVVQAGERVIWSMSYAGGLAPGITDRSEVIAVYAFLRKALLDIRADRPFRGPLLFEAGDLRYVNVPEGEIAAFHGEEQITCAGTRVYNLRYSGGIIR